MFHVPVEERKYNFDEQSFGGGSEGKQQDIVRDIIDRTGCDIEMSQTKDRCLTIMVTGKPPAVLKARKDLLQRLQTQVGLSLSPSLSLSLSISLSLTHTHTLSPPFLSLSPCVCVCERGGGD